MTILLTGDLARFTHFCSGRPDHLFTGTAGRALCRGAGKSALLGRGDHHKGVRLMIHPALLILAWLTPLMLVPLFLLAPHRAWKAMPMAALPGLAASLLVPAGSMVEIHSLLLGSRFGLDQISAGFLFFTSLIWALAALHAIGYIRMRHRSFGVYYLLAMTGNFGLVLAQDMISFYLFFALMVVFAS